MLDKPAPPSSAESSATDPVCGMKVTPATAKHKFEHDGKTFYFCCGGCLEKFRKSPDTYLNAAVATKPVIPITPSAPKPKPTTQTAAPC
jgi:Cu+-exporting ATPase